MLKIQVTTAEAVIQETELITAGRRGLECAFSFDIAWANLAKTVVVQGVVKRDIQLVGNSIVVPGECIAKENYPLKIGVYGANGDGDIAIPTVWASFGKILPSATRSDIPPDELTPDLVSQIEQNSANAIYLAQRVSQQAANGEFNGANGLDGNDGYSPTIDIESITGGHRVTTHDIAQVQSFDVMDGVDGTDGAGVPTGGTTGQYLRKASGTDYDTEWATMPEEVFWAVRGTTTSAQIEAAYQAGKVVCCSYNKRVYRLSNRESATDHYFTCIGGNSSYSLRCNNDSWGTATVFNLALSASVPSAATSSPADLGTAAVGSSAKYAKADHVHKMPSASDVGAIGDPGGGSTGQVLKKTAGGVEWANESGGGGTTEVFWATKGSTTSAEIEDAIDEGLLVCTMFNGRYFTLIYRESSTKHHFCAAYDKYIYTISCNNDSWDAVPSVSVVPSASSATPQALGTAAAGSSTDYSRADHVHAKPTAGDVGAISAPASPSAGDVLTYSSGAWAAAAPAHQIPAGGNAGECLAKNSSSDYNLRWRTINDWTPAGIMRTAGGTAAKVAEWSLWSAAQYPAWLVVTVGQSNTYAGAITLKVNGSTAYPIYINGAASSATNYTLPAGSYFVYFDGSKFDFRTDGKLPGDIIGHADKDIQAPASPTTGDFLVWNGSAWAAAPAVTEVTVSTAGAVTQALDAGKIYHFTGALTSLTITLNAAGTGQLAQYHFDFDSGSTAPTVTLPGTVTMQGGTFSPEASKHYEIDILNGYGVSVAW